ncbi:MAG: WecB/TagA/CpsF family glycosyltransferase [Methylococcaceae bacterium]
MNTSVTVCLCTYQRRSLTETLASLARQRLPDGLSMDIVVADNDPAESGRAVVDAFVQEKQLAITYVLAKQPGVVAARNCSVANAVGGWLAFIDDDEEADADWLKTLLECAYAYQASVVIGAVHTRYPAEAPAWIVEGNFSGRQLAPTGTRLDTGITGNALVHRNALPDPKAPFNPAFNMAGGEDTELFSRIAASGHRIVACREAQVFETVEPQRLCTRFLLRKALRVGETYARIFISPKPALSKSFALIRAGIQTVAAASFALLLLPLGRVVYMRYVIKACSNWGKLRHAMQRKPIELYHRASPLRVLHVVRQFYPAIGGLENFVQCLVLEQLQAGVQAEVLTLDSVFHRQPAIRLAHTEAIGPIQVRRISWWGSYKYPLAPAVLGYLQGYDIIHVHGLDFFADFLALTRFLHRHRLVLSTHGGFFHTQFAGRAKKFFFNTVTRRSLRNYSQVYACSEGDYQRFAPLCAAKLRLIENGVDVKKFADAGARQPTGVFAFIGRFSDNKRLDQLVDAFAALKKHAADYSLLIIGNDWDGNQARLIEQIHQLGLDSTVFIYTGLDNAAIQDQLRDVSFIISASEYEGFGMTLVEGMAAGLLPVASRIPSFEQIVLKSGVGLLVDFQDPVFAAAKIHLYAESCHAHFPALREQAMAAAGRYGWAGTAEKFLAAYHELFGENWRLLQGVRFDIRSGAEIIEVFDRTVKQGQFLQVAIANAHTVNLARNNAVYRKILSKALVLNDGIGINIASLWKYGKGFCENLNGTDFITRYLAESRLKLRIFLFGARPDIVKACFERCLKNFPQHEWLGFENGYIGSAQYHAVCERIRKIQPDVLLVALGNPLQELFIHRYGESMRAKLCIGVGGLFDFMSGKIKRAPLWVRRLRCEWVYRLAIEPQRMWRRYLIGNITFLIAAWRDRI